MHADDNTLTPKMSEPADQVTNGGSDAGTAPQDLIFHSTCVRRTSVSEQDRDLIHHVQIKLSRDSSMLQKLKDAAEIGPRLRTCPPNVISILLPIARNMLEDNTEPEWQRAAMQMLQNMALNVEPKELRCQLFKVISKPRDISLVNDQVNALVILIGHEYQADALSTDLVSFSLDYLPRLFMAAEHARRAASRERDDPQGRLPALTERPEEEKALLKFLSFAASILTEESRPSATEVSKLLSVVVELAGRTTGQAIMCGLLQIIRTCEDTHQIPFDQLENYLRLLCSIAVDNRYTFKREAQELLVVVITSAHWQAALDILVKKIFAQLGQSEPVRSCILDVMAKSCTWQHDSPARQEWYCTQVKNTCQSYVNDAQSSTSLLRPLIDLVAGCGVVVDTDTLEALLRTIKAQASLLPPKGQPVYNVKQEVVDGLIKLFMKFYMISGPKTRATYEALIQVADLANEASVRLSVMKLLARLRCTSQCSLEIIRIPDSQDLPKAFYQPHDVVSHFHPSASPSSQPSTTRTLPTTKADHTRDSGLADRTQSPSGSKKSSGRGERFNDTKDPQWLHAAEEEAPFADLPSEQSDVSFVWNPKSKQPKDSSLDLACWLRTMVHELGYSSDWETYSYVLVYLPSQLSNCSLFEGYAKEITDLHELLNTQLSQNSFPDPPQHSRLRRGDVALCLYHSLAMLLAYQDLIGVRQWNRTVATIRAGIEKYDRVGRYCINVLTICCYEIPYIIENHLNVIIEMMQKRITQSDLAVDILEFLGGLARVPEAYNRSDIALHQKVFGICIRYIQHARERRREPPIYSSPRVSGSNHLVSGASSETSRLTRGRDGDDGHKSLHEYVFTIAYQAMIFWFLAIDIRERARHVPWITQELAWKGESGREEMEQQSMVFLDLMHRTTFSNLGETKPTPQFADGTRRISRGSWLVGLSVVTLEMMLDETGKAAFGQFTKRQASGTTHAVYYHNTEDRPTHQAPEVAASPTSSNDRPSIYPSHLILQLISTISPEPIPLQPIPLPDDDEFVNRALSCFDGTDTVDGHKAAVIYVGANQTREQNILANEHGSEAFEALLSGLGFKVSLQGSKFNTQGLDRQFGSDGTHTYAWRDRVTEIVYHVPTMMPNDLSNDASFARKKSHIGNDHVKIIFNDSGLAYDSETFTSDFNSVDIVITPEARSLQRGGVKPKLETGSDRICEASATDKFGYFHVQVVTSDRYPKFSPAADVKVISAGGLPPLVRQLAITASVFCQVWPANVGDYTSPWRFRLQQIMKLRERYANANASANVDYPQAADDSPTPFKDGSTWSGLVAYGGMAETDKLVSNLDFTRWTK